METYSNENISKVETSKAVGGGQRPLPDELRPRFKDSEIGKSCRIVPNGCRNLAMTLFIWVKNVIVLVPFIQNKSDFLKKKSKIYMEDTEILTG